MFIFFTSVYGGLLQPAVFSFDRCEDMGDESFLS